MKEDQLYFSNSCKYNSNYDGLPECWANSRCNFASDWWHWTLRVAQICKCAHFRLVCDPFEAINDNSGAVVACDRLRMFRLWDTHTSLAAQPIYDPFVSLVQKWLEASGKQMLCHVRYGPIRTRRTCLVCSKSFFRSDEASFLQKLHTSLHTSDWSVILLTL